MSRSGRHSADYPRPWRGTSALVALEEAEGYRIEHD